MIVSRRGRHYARVYMGEGRYEYGKTRSTVEAAVIDHAEIELRKAKGEKAKDQPETVVEFADRWLTDFNRKPRSGKERWGHGALQSNRYALAPLKEEFGAEKLATLPDNRDFHKWLVQQPASNVKTYRTMFADAVKARAMSENPAAGLRLEQSRGRSDLVVLTEEETVLLADTALSYWGGEFGLKVKAIVDWQVSVGTRGIGLRNLRVEDLRGSEVYVRHPGKGVKPRTIYVPERARVAVGAMPRALDQKWLFTTKTGLQLTKSSLYAAWDPVRRDFERKLDPRRAQELRDSREDGGLLEMHELRHCAATTMRRRGAGWEQIGWQLCHDEKDAGYQAKDTYTHLTEEDHLGAMRAVFSEHEPQTQIQTQKEAI